MPLNKVLGPDIPQNPLVFLFFCFFWFLFEVFWFLVVSIADKSLRSPKPKKLEENQKKQKKQCLWTKSLAQTFLRILWFFCFFWFLFEVFWFSVVSVADKSLRSPKPKKRDENQLTATLKKQFLAQTFLVCIFVQWKKEQASEENPGPKHSWESFVFHFVVWCSLRFQNSKERKFRFDIILTLDKRKIKRKQKHAKRGTAQRCFLFSNGLVQLPTR